MEEKLKKKAQNHETLMSRIQTLKKQQQKQKPQEEKSSQGQNTPVNGDSAKNRQVAFILGGCR